VALLPLGDRGGPASEPTNLFVLALPLGIPSHV